MWYPCYDAPQPSTPPPLQMRETALIRSAHNGHLHTVRRLLDQGADPNAMDLVGQGKGQEGEGAGGGGQVGKENWAMPADEGVTGFNSQQLCNVTITVSSLASSGHYGIICYNFKMVPLTLRMLPRLVTGLRTECAVCGGFSPSACQVRGCEGGAPNLTLTDCHLPKPHPLPMRRGTTQRCTGACADRSVQFASPRSG